MMKVEEAENSLRVAPKAAEFLAKRNGPEISGPFALRSACCLKLFVEVACRAGDIHSAGDAALTVFDPLHDAGGFAALGTVG